MNAIASPERMRLVAREHRIVYESDGDYGERRWVACTCSHLDFGGDYWTGEDEADHSAHVAEALLASGAVVDLDALFADLRTEVRSSFPNAPLVTAAQEAIERRLRWASLHWGTPGVHPDAWPHIAAAACEGVEQYARTLGSERAL